MYLCKGPQKKNWVEVTTGKKVFAFKQGRGGGALSDEFCQEGHFLGAETRKETSVTAQLMSNRPSRGTLLGESRSGEQF